MINTDRNIRFNITISKKQYAWLKDFSKKKGLRISQLISWLLAKKTKDVIDTLNLTTNPHEEVEKKEIEYVSDEEMEELMKQLNEVGKTNENTN